MRIIANGLGLMVATAAGALSGLAVTVVSSEAPKSDPVAQPTKTVTSVDDNGVARARANWRLRLLEARLAELEGATPAEEEDSPVHPTSAVEQETPPSIDGEIAEAQRQEAIAEWEAQLDSHSTEPRDPSWAVDIERSFAEQLEQLDEGALDVESVECRTTTCLAAIQFSSFRDATEYFAELLHHDYAGGCGTSITMPEPERSDEPYTARLLLRCEPG